MGRGGDGLGSTAVNRRFALGALALVVAVPIVGVLLFRGAGESGDPSAVLDVVEELVEHSTGGEYRTATDGDVVEVGHSVRTDDAGAARLDYADGSLARLGPDTEFTLVALDQGAGERQVRAELEVGETWHRVVDLSGSDDEPDGSYEVQTAVATAAVRGTGFAVVCLVRDVCTFTVAEGEVEVTGLDGESVVLGPGGRLTVTAGEVGTAEQLSPDELRSDPWIEENLDLDAELPDDPVDDETAAGPTEAELAGALVAGTWSAETVTVESPGRVRDGEQLERTYRFEVEDCDAAPCDLAATVELADGTALVPVAFDDGAYRYETSFDLDCGDVADALTTRLTWSFRVTDAERDGATWRATRIEGEIVENQTENRASDCQAARLRHRFEGSIA